MNFTRTCKAFLMALFFGLPIMGYSQNAGFGTEYTRLLYGAGASVIFTQPINLTLPEGPYEGSFSTRGASGYGASFNTRLDLMPNLFLNLGLQYSEIGYQLRYNPGDAENSTTEVNNRQGSIGLPLMFYFNPFNLRQQYKMFKNKWKLFFTGGLNLRYAWSTHNSARYEGFTPGGNFIIIQNAGDNQLNPLVNFGAVITSPYRKWGVVDLYAIFSFALNSQTPTSFIFSNDNTSNRPLLTNATSRLGFLSIGMIYYPFRSKVKTAFSSNFQKYNGKDCPNGYPEDPTPPPFKTF